MRVNTEFEQAEIMEGDMSFLLGAFIRQYCFLNKNVPPKRIVIPMIRTVTEPSAGTVEVHFIPIDSPIAAEIREDTKNVSAGVKQSDVQPTPYPGAFNPMCKKCTVFPDACKGVEKGTDCTDPNGPHILDNAPVKSQDKPTPGVKGKVAPKSTPGGKMASTDPVEAVGDTTLATPAAVAANTPTVGATVSAKEALSRINNPGRVPKKAPNPAEAGPLSNMGPRVGRDLEITASDLADQPDIKE